MPEIIAGSLHALSYMPHARLARSSVTGLSSSGSINHFKVVITSIDATSIKGTFSGDVFLGGDLTQAKKTVTNGDFYAKFQ